MTLLGQTANMGEESDGHEPGWDGTVARLLAGPRGLGTSALRIPGLSGPSVWDPHLVVPYAEREWGDGSYPPLYCPRTVRIDEELGAEVNRRLVAWAGKTGIYAGRRDTFSDIGFGRLV